MSKVLIVENDPMVVAIISRYLENMGGMKVFGPVTKTTEMLAVIEREKIELILLAVYLKETNGLDLLRELRMQAYEGEIIMVTAACTASEIKKAYAYGVIDYVIKPFTYERLKMAVLKAQKRHMVMEQRGRFDQEALDELMHTGEQEIALPKGLNRHTLERVVTYLKEDEKRVWTLRELAKVMSVSNVTIKKYMDYLEAREMVSVVMTSGQIGRPEHQYRLLGSK